MERISLIIHEVHIRATEFFYAFHQGRDTDARQIRADLYRYLDEELTPTQRLHAILLMAYPDCAQAGENLARITTPDPDTLYKE